MPCETDAYALLPPLFQKWFKSRRWRPHDHQLQMLDATAKQQSSLLIAPTGGGKTLAGFLPSLVELQQRPAKGMHTIYISPLKALANDIHRNLQVPVDEMGLDITIEMRTGDTSSSRRQRQLRKPPHILLTTPESLELLLSYVDADALFKGLRRVIIDEVHSLAPGKRGHLTSLCLAHLYTIAPELTLSGLSATVAEPRQLARWLGENVTIITAAAAVKPRIRLLKTQARVPWSGYMGTYAVREIYDAVARVKSCIVFVNTRAQAELLFQRLWEVNEQNLSIALHHGSLEREHRLKVEGMMNEGRLRAIIATASLDLGLDWAAVDQVIQVGAPRGISRMLQRVGRSNHRLDKPSVALLVPCNRFEMIECTAVIQAIEEGIVDGDDLMPGTLDVLAQFVMNSACGKGFEPLKLYDEIVRAFPYRDLSWETFEAIISFVATGGYALRVYDNFHRIERNDEGRFVASQAATRRHRMNIGTIVEYETIRVSMRNGKSRRSIDLGKIEEYFVQGLLPGDTFIFAGRLLRYKGIRNERVEVEKAKGDRPKIPSFKGGRLPLSPSLADRVRALIEDTNAWQSLPPAIQQWLQMQKHYSALPDAGHMLAESFMHDRKDYLVLYTFGGRNANQSLGLLLSYHMEREGLLPLGFAANDYALALWGLKPIADPQRLLEQALTQGNCNDWVESSQMSKRVFRDVAVISGLVERRYAGGKKTGRQITISTDLIYDVLRKYEPDHILLRATREDVNNRLADVDRLKAQLSALPVRHLYLARVSPLAIPLLVEIGSETIKGQAETVLLRAELMEKAGDQLLKRATDG